MTKNKIKEEVVNKVNDYLKDKYIHIDGPHMMEEYGTTVVTKAVLREALNMTFTETHKLTTKTK